MNSIQPFARFVTGLAVLCAAPSVHAQDSLAAGCPVTGMGASSAPVPPAVEYDGQTLQEWWPNQLDLRVLHQNSAKSDPLGGDFDYAKEFAKLDLDQLKKDITEVMTTSQDWWPADWGNYGPLFIRMAWHSAGTYRVTDGRGGASDGTQRFAPLNSWPDNGNLDKARRLLWPIKQKYGQKISWADLMVLAGNCALEHAGLETFGFAGGREDVWEPQQDVFWGPESEWLGDERYSGERELANPLAAVQMGLIYVNPEGPNGNPDPLAAAKDIRETFGRMAMNDEETVALIAGGHTLGKCHGAGPADRVGPDPEAAPIEAQGLGWISSHGSGKGGDTITSGLEGAWTATPTTWSNSYFGNLFRYEWELTKSPAGAHQWTPKDGPKNVPDAHDPEAVPRADDADDRPLAEGRPDLPVRSRSASTRTPTSSTRPSRGLVQADAPRHGAGHARCSAPRSRRRRSGQDPVPAVDHALIGEREIAALKKQILDSGLTTRELVSAAWASAATFRDSDKRGGANGARVRLAPQKDWDANQPAELAKVLGTLERIQSDFNAGAAKVSLADVIVLAGCAAVEDAAAKAGHDVSVPFTPGRTDATAEMTDAASFAVLEPRADGFRNYLADGFSGRPEEALVDRANLLTLTAPEMTVLVGGLRSLGVSQGGAHGVFTARPGTLSNDWFVNLLDLGTEWKKSARGAHMFEGRDRDSGELKWTATSVDLVFGSHSQLRAIAEVYGSSDAGRRFVDDFVAAWTKVMELDRFDVKG